MHIGEVAAATGVSAKTVRFWEERRLLVEPARTPGGYRAYTAEVVERIAFIRNAQAAGFSLDQIRQVLDIASSGAAPCDHVRELIAGRLADVEARIAELEATRERLRLLAIRAADQDPAECRGYCVIIMPAPSARRAVRAESPLRRRPRP